MEESQKEPEKTENQKEEPEKTENQKEEPEKIENKNEESEKIENQKEEPEKIENQKEEPEKIENQKEEPEKVENKNEESEKVENKNEEPEKVENKNEEPEKVENKNEEPEKVENKTEEKESLEKPKIGGRKIPLMKKSIEEVLRKVVRVKKMFKFIKRRIPGKIDAEKRLLNMRQDSIRPKKELEEDDFENLNIANRTSTVKERIFKIECDIKKLEEEKKMIEEERKKREERRKNREAERKKREEERKKKEEEERRKKEEEERKKREEEERKKKEEEEKKAKEVKKGVEKIKEGFLNKLNKKEEELNTQEKISLAAIIEYEKSVEEYINSTVREASENAEGKDIKYKFEEVRQIENEPLSNIEITKSGKIIALSYKELSKITIYTEKTFEEEDCIILESKVNSIAIVDNSIYCALEENEDNILIISLDNKDDQVYLSGHACPVTDLTLTKYGYLVSSDVEGNIFVWKNNEIKKTGNCFHSCINTITETKENTQGIAILNFQEEIIKFYDLRYSTLECLETITNIKGSGRKNNMLRLNENILAVAGTYIYIIDLNSLIVTNMINCLYANESISTFHFNDKGYFFVSQALNHAWTDEYEKGILGYYQYNFKDPLYPDNNTLVKLASMPNSHGDFITSIKQIDSNTIATGGLDGKIKFWVLKDIK